MSSTVERGARWISGNEYWEIVAADRMSERLREAMDRARRHWHGFHLERAGQIPFPGLERPFEEIDAGACLLLAQQDGENS